MSDEPVGCLDYIEGMLREWYDARDGGHYSRGDGQAFIENLEASGYRIVVEETISSFFLQHNKDDERPF